VRAGRTSFFGKKEAKKLPDAFGLPSGAVFCALFSKKALLAASLP
jgi:hypothetical protein